jgi:uncharacterized protein YecE (DUF72 family)
MKFWVGTSGYSYREWKGGFYPEDLPADEMLRFYATRLPAVEINNTFYRLPKASVVESWAEQVPSGFRFVIKASRRITHIKRLKNALSETDYLFTTLRSLDRRLGAVLFQLPPQLRMDLPRLSSFLEMLPGDARAAFEFRHDSWFDDAVYACLQGKNAALCTAEDGEGDGTPLVETADWGYVRLRRPDYSEAELSGWADRFRELGWNEAFVFFKHEEDVEGPELAGRFLKIVETG